MYTNFCTFFIKLLLSSQVFFRNTVVVAFDEVTSTAAMAVTAHFADANRGRMSWIIDESSLPWTGQYYYIESTQSLVTNLLVVADSSNGYHLATCTSHAPRDNKWRRFFWTLTEDSLICNVTYTEPIITKVDFQASTPRTFSLRILAQQGPKCFRDMIVQNEKLQGCPPKLQRNSFQEMFVDCGCPVPTQELSNFDINQQLLTFTMRPSISPFHFINSRIFASGGNFAVPHHLLPGLPWNISNKFVSPTTTTTVITEIPFGTTTIIANTTAIKHSLLSLNPPVNIQHEIDLVSSHEHLPVSGTPTDESSEVPTTEELPELKTQSCAGKQCQNNGTCVLGSDGTAACMCPDGFLGSHCEINLCANVHCMHGGLCQTTGNVPHCKCPVGTTGTICEKVLCNPPCEQGGICVLTNGIPVCRCPTGTFGINCNIMDSCNNNVNACVQYGREARCQLEPNSFVLISPVPVNATYSCLCLDENSEWVNCKQLLTKAQVTLIASPSVTSVTPNNLFPETETSVPILDTTEQLRSGQHIVRLFQNNPHLTHLFPGSLLIPNGTGTMTLVPTFISAVQNLNPSIGSSNETLPGSSHEPIQSIQLFTELLPTTTELPFNTTTHFPILLSMNVSPLHSNPKSFFFQHPFPVTPESNSTLEPEVIPINETTTAEADTLRSSESVNFINSRTLTTEANISSFEESSKEMSEKLHQQTTVGLQVSLPKLETSTSPEWIPEMTTYAITSNQFATNLFETSSPHITVPVMTASEQETSPAVTTQPSQFTSSIPDFEESTQAITVINISTEQLTDHQISTVTSSIVGTENEWRWSERNITKEEQTTMAPESVQTIPEDEVKYVKLTVGLPTMTTTIVIPDSKYPFAGATGSRNDASRSGTSSSWAIVLAVIFALIVLTGVCAVMTLRYIRRSRKLHGKYNPAREESVLSSSYSMPMTTVTKEERLI